MSVHPNAMLMAHLSPGDLPRKTFLAILKDHKGNPDESFIKIGGFRFYVIMMEESYDESWQISGVPGEIVLMNMVTYGYGERILWDALAERKNVLSEWIAENKDRYVIESSEISIGANYW